MKGTGGNYVEQRTRTTGERTTRNTRTTTQRPGPLHTKVILVKEGVKTSSRNKAIMVQPQIQDATRSVQHLVLPRKHSSPFDSDLRSDRQSQQQQVCIPQQHQQQQQSSCVVTQSDFVSTTSPFVTGPHHHHHNHHHHQQQHHMDPYPLAPSQTPHHHLQTATPGTYTVYADNYYYHQYHPSLSPPTPSGQTTYIIPGIQQTSPNLDDGGSGQLSHTTRASPATIQWLLQNYETAEGVSLPRCTLYSHYLRHCTDNKLDPVNAASFGKLIRSVFLGLRTRRLGTRGNSKYHYYGIRIKPESPLNRVFEEQTSMSMRNTWQQPSGRTRHRPHSSSTSPLSANSHIDLAMGVPSHHQQLQQQQQQQQQQQEEEEEDSPASGHPSVQMGSAIYRAETTDQSTADEIDGVLGIGQVPQVSAPDSKGLEETVAPLALTLHQVGRFVNGYRQNCEFVLECIKRLQFTEVEECWRNFWQPENEQEENEDDRDGESQSGLSQSQLFSLCTVSQIQQFVQKMDLAFYQVVIDVLIPDVLKTPLTQQIRTFAKGLESQLSLAMQGAPDTIQRVKLTAVRTLAQSLRRYTSLNHLAQAARAVLQHPGQISQMLKDLNCVNFQNVQEQASWVCKCDPFLIDQLQRDFKANLSTHKRLEQWANWLETVVDQVLASHHDLSLEELAHVAKQFILKWSFYSSMVIRDLTLRSAHSFGSFHLIRLLYDEYIFYIVEQKLAKAADLSCIAIMTQHPDLLRFNDCQSASDLINYENVSNHDGFGIESDLMLRPQQQVVAEQQQQQQQRQRHNVEDSSLKMAKRQKVE